MTDVLYSISIRSYPTHQHFVHNSCYGISSLSKSRIKAKQILALEYDICKKVFPGCLPLLLIPLIKNVSV